MNGYKIVLLKAIFMLYRLPESERVCSGICNFGKDKVTMDFAFFAIAFNIKKMCAKIKNEKMTDKNYQNIRVA